MLSTLVSMRQLVAKPIWFDHIAALSADEDGNIQADEVIASAAAVYAVDEATWVSIAMDFHEVVESLDDYSFVHTAQDLCLLILDKAISKYSRSN